MSERGERVENKPNGIRGCKNAKVEQVIVTLALSGSGTSEDPYKLVKQYWTFDGKLLFELPAD